jgi:hypothetical protein
MDECSLCDVENLPLTSILYWQTGSVLNTGQCEDLSELGISRSMSAQNICGQVH